MAHRPSHRKSELPRVGRRVALSLGALGLVAPIGVSALARGVDSGAPDDSVALPDSGTEAATPAATAQTTAAAQRSLELSRFGFLVGQPDLDGAAMVKQDADLVSGLGMGWVRFGVDASEAVKSWDGRGGSVVLHESVCRVVEDSIDHARAQHLKVCLMVIDVWPDHAASDDEFMTKMRHYWSAIAQRFGSKVEQVQIFNEADGQHYRTNASLGAEPGIDYLHELADRLATAREVFHAANPQTKVTTNLIGYPATWDVEPRWNRILDVIAPSIDLITVDAYPQLQQDVIYDLPHKLERLQQRYGKPLAVGELGLNTCATCATPADQARGYGMYIHALRSSVAEAVFFYKLRDGENPQDPGSTFGVVSRDGHTPKPSWNTLIMASGRTPNESTTPTAMLTSR